MLRNTLLFAALVSHLGCVSQAPAPAPTPTPTVAPAPAAAPAAEPRDSITIGEAHKLASTIMGEERKYLVHLPPGYQESKSDFGVIYLLDGPGHFHHVSGIVSFLSNQGRMPPMIIVAIANTDRTRDLTPTNEKRAPTSGGADRFLDFIEKELMPKIEADYRVSPFKLLIGHSFGGLFAVHALLTRPGLFNAHIAASPSLQWDNNLMATKAKPMFAKGQLASGFLYFTLGSEPEQITAGNRGFEALLKGAAPDGFRWGFDLFENEDHGSVVHRTVYTGLERLFQSWQNLRKVKTADQLKAAEKALVDEFQMAPVLSEGFINVRGYQQLQAKPPNVAAARSLFELNIERYPESANPYDSLGELLEAGGDLAGALANYEKAVANSKPDDQNHAVFVANRDRVKAALAK